MVAAGEDRELDAIRQIVVAFDSADGLDDLVALLRRHAEAGSQFDMLDLCGHSKPPGFVVLGTWVIDDLPQTVASFRQLLSPALAVLGIRIVRLLGCSTAVTPRARHALRRIEQATRCRVVGTKRYVSARDYGLTGFRSDEVLLDASGKSVDDAT